jgi:hypothetical protein
LCYDVPTTHTGSQTWRNLLNALPLIVHWLAWKPWSGDSIIMGKDEILGMGNASYLSTELIKHLNDNKVYYLYQVRRVTAHGTFCTNSLTNFDLGLVGDLALEWDHFRHGLIEAVIALSDSQDELRWTGGAIAPAY